MTLEVLFKPVDVRQQILAAVMLNACAYGFVITCTCVEPYCHRGLL